MPSSAIGYMSESILSWKHESVRRRVQKSDIEVYSELGLEVYLEAFSAVCFGAFGELTWECTIKLAVSVPSCTLRSIL